MRAAVKYPLTIYYDASCPMCASEIHALRDLDTLGRLHIRDCSAPDFCEDAILAEGVTRATLMGRIHARDADGRWLIGIDCFETIYEAARLEGVARLLGNPLLRPALALLYPWIARYRQILSRLGLNTLVRALIPKPRRTLN
jgi:predicted DCC family thiol-disulfide oxidoreductase YuxK